MPVKINSMPKIGDKLSKFQELVKKKAGNALGFAVGAGKNFARALKEISLVNKERPSEAMELFKEIASMPLLLGLNGSSKLSHARSISFLKTAKKKLTGDDSEFSNKQAKLVLESIATISFAIELLGNKANEELNDLIDFFMGQYEEHQDLVDKFAKTQKVQNVMASISDFLFPDKALTDARKEKFLYHAGSLAASFGRLGENMEFLNNATARLGRANAPIRLNTNKIPNHIEKIQAYQDQ